MCSSRWRNHSADSLSDAERTAILAAEDAAKKLNDDGVLATEADGKAFFEANGNTVTSPDVAAFRTRSSTNS